MNNTLTLRTTHDFNGIAIDFFQNAENEFVFTREQIGQALGYSDFHRAISKIHERNSQRFEGKSMVVKMTTTEKTRWGGERQYEREVWLYNRKGVMEICRFSRQPLADAFMDWVWDRIDELMKNGYTAFDLRAVKMTQTEILAQITQWMVGVEQENIERDRLIDEANNKADELNKKSNEMKQQFDKAMRDDFNFSVRYAAENTGKKQRAVYGYVYKAISKKHGIDIYEAAKDWNCKKIDVLERLGFMPDGIKMARWYAGKNHQNSENKELVNCQSSVLN